MLDGRGWEGNPNPSTPAFSSSHDWIKWYLVVHRLSPASYRYAYLLWFFFAFCLLLFACLGFLGHICSNTTRPGGIHTLVAAWHKWAIKGPSLWRRRHRKEQSTAAQRQAQPASTTLPSQSLPPPPPNPKSKSKSNSIRKTAAKYTSTMALGNAPLNAHLSDALVNGQVLALVVLFVVAVLVSVVGPDYIKPGIGSLDFARWKRSVRVDGGADDEQNVYAVPPQYTIQKAWWTAGGRTGLIAFALIPLCVLVALKAPPFALLALPAPLPHFYSDKLAWLHRWTGRLIYLLTVAHVLLWSVQLANDRRDAINGGGIAWIYVFDYDKFVFGIIAFVCMTFLIAFSFASFRRSDFEMFYTLHIIFVPLTLIFSSLHFPPVGPFCWSALALWGGERVWRLVRTMRLNGGVSGLISAKIPISAYASAKRRTGVPPTRVKVNHVAHAQELEWNFQQKPTPIDGDADDDAPFDPYVAYLSANQQPQPPVPPPAASTHSSPAFREHVELPAIMVTKDSASSLSRVSPSASPSTPTQTPMPLSPSSDSPAAPQSIRKPHFPPSINASISARAVPTDIPSPRHSPSSSSTTSSPTSTNIPRPERQRRLSNSNSSSVDTTPDALLIPAGCGRAQLLPGRTIRLTVRMHRPLSRCAPGQYVFLGLPALSTWTSHPFTIASIREETEAGETGERYGVGSKDGTRSTQLLEFIIRARQGLTLDLWNHLHRAVNRAALNSSSSAAYPSLSTRAPTSTFPTIPADDPLLMRVRVDGAYGSATRMKWDGFGTVLIVVGGSGVAFGLAILEHLTRKLETETKRYKSSIGRSLSLDAAERGGKSLRNFLTGNRRRNQSGEHEGIHITRVRFVWLVREYSHLTWCASALRRCIQRVHPSVLQVDIFVTNFAPRTRPPDLASLRVDRDPSLMSALDVNSLVPPHPKYASGPSRSRYRASSPDGSTDSDSGWSSDDSLADLSYRLEGESYGAPSRRARRHPRGSAQPSSDGGAAYHGVYDDSDEDDVGDTGRNFVVELTNFDGEEDAKAPGESSFSARVRKQGRHVRRKTMIRDEVKEQHRPPQDIPVPNTLPILEPSPIGAESDSPTADIAFARLLDEPTSQLPISTPTMSSSTSSRPSLVDTHPLAPHTFGVAHDLRQAYGNPRLHTLRLNTQVSSHSPLSPQYQPHGTHDPSTVSSFSHRSLHGSSSSYPPRPQRHQRRASSRRSIAESLYSQHTSESNARSSMGEFPADAASLRGLLSASELQFSPQGGQGADFLFHLSPREREDLSFIAALARPGRPRLDKILSSEADRSTGAVAVASCGPGSLDAVVRKVVAMQIDLHRIWKGDLRGDITLYNEEFSF